MSNITSIISFLNHFMIISWFLGVLTSKQVVSTSLHIMFPLRIQNKMPLKLVWNYFIKKIMLDISLCTNKVGKKFQVETLYKEIYLGLKGRLQIWKKNLEPCLPALLDFPALDSKILANWFDYVHIKYEENILSRQYYSLT